MYGDIRDDWKLREIERKAEEAERVAQRACNEADALRRDVDRLECALRQASAEIDGLRAQLETCMQRLGRLEE